MTERRKNDRVRKALAAMLNVTLTSGPEGYEKAARFLKEYGELRPRSSMPEAEAVEYARRLRDVWSANMREEIERANAALNELLKAGDPIKSEGPAFTADLRARKLQLKPRTLLHELALQLLQFPKSIGKCKNCGKYFVKTWPRDAFCAFVYDREGTTLKNDCSNEFRKQRQRNLMRKRRKRA